MRHFIKLIAFVFFIAFLFTPASKAVESDGFIITKHIIPSKAPYKEPKGTVTPDGTFNIRDKNAPFYSDKLADAMGLDREGRLPNGKYLNLNNAIYTSYRLASDKTAPNTILILMPGTWVGAMSLDQFARDFLRMAQKEKRDGIEVWLIDRRSEQLEDHTGFKWLLKNPSLSVDEQLQGLMDYYRPAFNPDEKGAEFFGRRFVPLDHNALRFMANWGADTTIRDWRAVVIEAHRVLGNEILKGDSEEPEIMKKPGKRLFIGGHSLGGSLAVLYASYDFDRRPDHTLVGANDVDGLVLLEGGGFPKKKPKTIDANSYLESLRKRYKNGKVYFDMNMFGIRYEPSTMLSLAISGWAAYNARGKECTFPQYSRPKIVQLPHITNEAVLAFAMDDDISDFFIARLSLGYPKGEIKRKGQFRTKISLIPIEPNECRLITPWRFGHKPVDPEFVYDWQNIDKKPSLVGKKCQEDNNRDPEVSDLYAFARSSYGYADEYLEEPGLSTGPNDYAEWYFPPRLSTDAGKLGSKIVEKDGTELFNGTYVEKISLPVIYFTGDDSMGQYRVPELSERNFPQGVLAQKETQVHLIRGYTHMDITQATRNNQEDLAPDYENFNACSVYSYRFISAVSGW